MKSKPFSAEDLFDVLRNFPATKHYWVAYSGGCDSHVLLHAIASLREQFTETSVTAVHINHGLHINSDDWARHCEDICRSLNIDCIVRRVDARPRSGESREAAARDARYAAFASLIEASDVILTAHHQDDQAETVLLQLFRGAGPAGLAAMPDFAKFHHGNIARPLLGWRRADLFNYATDLNLHWIEDPSNSDVSFDRNYLRHHVFSSIEKQWPAATRVLSRVATLQAEADLLLQEFAAQDMLKARDVAPNTLKISALKELSAARQRNVLRCWLRELSLAIPSAAQMQKIQQDVLGARADAEPCLKWSTIELRRYRDLLYVMQQMPAQNSNIPMNWIVSQPLTLPTGGILTSQIVLGEGLDLELCRDVTVRFRQGGERCRIGGQVHHRTVKNLLQERGIPSWQRHQIPLIYIGDQLAAIVGVCVCEPFAARKDKLGIQIHWSADARFSERQI